MTQLEPLHDPLAVFAATMCALLVAHQLGDHWVQTDHQARHKVLPGWAGRWACAGHVLGLVLTKAAALLALVIVLDVHFSTWHLMAGLTIDAVSHYWADRRTTLAWLAALIPGKASFYQLGAPRPGHDDNPSLGTGAYALDQSWHIGWLFAAALIIAGGS